MNLVRNLDAPEGEEMSEEQCHMEENMGMLVERIQSLSEYTTHEELIDFLAIEHNTAKKHYNKFFNYKKDSKFAYEVEEDE